MDEPLSNLDAKLRVQMRADVAGLQARLGVTTVYVTHDQAEAMTLGHRVAVLKDGQLQQCAAPRELYDRPANTFVAGFIGSPAMSLCTVPLGTNGSVYLGAAKRRAGRRRVGRDHRARSRQRRRRPAARGARDRGRWHPRRRRGRGGARAPTRTSSALSEVAGGEARLTARSNARRTPQRGDRIALRPMPGEAHLFDPETGERLPD